MKEKKVVPILANLSISSSIKLQIFELFSQHSKIGHLYFFYIYEEVAIVVESVIHYPCFASAMSFSSCYSHSPLVYNKVHFLCFSCFFNYLHLLLCNLICTFLAFWWIFLGPFCFNLVFIKWGFCLKFKVSNFGWKYLKLKTVFLLSFIWITNASLIKWPFEFLLLLIDLMLGACWYIDSKLCRTTIQIDWWCVWYWTYVGGYR